MLGLRGLAIVCLVGLACAQYGPPKQIGPVKHRTTTTTDKPPELNEIFPEGGSSVYQPPPQYQPSAAPTQPNSYGYGGQLPAPQPNLPGQQPAQPPTFPGGPSPQQPNFPGQQPQSQYQPPPPPGSVPVKPVDISKNPFLNAGMSGKPVSSGTYQPQPGPPPSYHGSQPGQSPTPPTYPSPPVTQPNPPNPPSPGTPPTVNIQGNPFLSGTPPQRPPSSSGAPVPKPPPFRPQPPQQPSGYPTDGTPYNPPSNQVSPSQPNPNNPFLSGAGQKPQQPGGYPSSGSSYQPGQIPAGQPNQPGQNPSSPPFQPPQQPQQPGGYPSSGSSYQPGQIPAGQPNLPGQKPSSPPFQPPQQPQQPGGYPSSGSSYQPGQIPAGQPNQPGLNPPNPPFFPGQQPQQPQQSGGYPTGGSSYQPGQIPVGPPNQPGQNKPNPTFQPQQPGGYPTSGSSYKPGQTTPEQPYQPGLIDPRYPEIPGQQPSQPNEIPIGLPKPPNTSTRPGLPCYEPGRFCVPTSSCYNGVITGTNAPETTYRSGECSVGQTCCQAAPKGNSYTPTYRIPVTEGPVQKYTGPINTDPPTECAAALKCVPESFCDEMGVMRDAPVALTREQQENKVPLSECLNPDTGVLGKCCRDPNYKDPWPAGMMMPGMMPKVTDGQGFDDGQYRPGQYPGESGQPGTPQAPGSYQSPGAVPTIAPPNPYTIKKPLGVFGANPTPFPVGPKPGQTHSDVFPKNEDKLANPSYQQTAGPQSHPVPLPNQTPGSPGGPTSPYGPGITPPSGPAQPPQSGGLPGVYREPLPNDQSQGPYNPGPQQPGSSGLEGSSSQPQGYTPGSFQPGSSAPVTPGQKCGVRRPAPPTRPDETGFGEFPWHAVIQTPSNRSSLCSAVIIAPNAVLTSAHCIQGLAPQDMVVVAGEWTLGQPGPKPSQPRAAGASAIHPVYNAGSLVKDQAVVVTEVPFQFDQHVDKVCLPQSGPGDYVPKTGTCFLTGFGRPALQNNSPGTILHKVTVTIVPKDQCENNLKQTHLGNYFKLNEGFACAAPINEAELCKVDVGSPLVCDRGDGQYEVAGIYSWDTKCTSSLPGVVASPDTNWINQVLATPIDQLRTEQPKPLDHLPEDPQQKPGFALGYGK